MVKKQLNQNILIELINLSAGTQQRPLSPDAINHYQELRKDGIELPPVELIYSGSEYYLWDGFHRLAVAQNLGETHIRGNVELGSLRHAVFMSYHANGQHGVPRPVRATAFIIDKMLADPEWSKMSLAEIGRHIGCARQTVFKRKKEVSCQRADKSDSQQGASTRGASAPPQTETEPKSPLCDDEGQVVPTTLADRFLSRSVIKERINELDKIKNAVMNKIGDGDLTYCLLNQSGFKSDYKNLRARLKSAIPYAICCYCKGKGCGACHNMGLLNRDSWKAAPKNE